MGLFGSSCFNTDACCGAGTFTTEKNILCFLFVPGKAFRIFLDYFILFKKKSRPEDPKGDSD